MSTDYADYCWKDKKKLQNAEMFLISRGHGYYERSEGVFQPAGRWFRCARHDKTLGEMVSLRSP